MLGGSWLMAYGLALRPGGASPGAGTVAFGLGAGPATVSHGMTPSLTSDSDTKPDSYWWPTKSELVLCQRTQLNANNYHPGTTKNASLRIAKIQKYVFCSSLFSASSPWLLSLAFPVHLRSPDGPRPGTQPRTTNPQPSKYN